MTEPDTFARIVAIACHDLRTPLATVYGFARTLSMGGLEPPADRYVEMIEAASSELTDLLDELALISRIHSGRYEPALTEIDSLELARAAVEVLDEGRVVVTGEGALVQIDVIATKRALGQLARAATRHGGLDSIDLLVRGPVLELSPLAGTAEQVVTGRELRELSALAAGWQIEAIGGSLQADDGRLVIRLPQ